MKKILYGAALLALAAGCAENELDSISTQQNKIEGVTFKAELEEPATRAQWEKEGAQWNMFWYAERDKMDIYVKNAAISNPNTPVDKRTNIADWDASNGKAVYKASRTLGEGYFVTDDNTKAINFTWNNAAKPEATWFTPSFRYVWPAGTSVTTGLVATLPALNGQKQTDMNGASTIKYAFMSGKMDNVEIPADSASGSDVLIGLKLTRKFPLAVYSVKNYDDYKKLFGNLKSITITSKGQKKADGNVDATKKENIDYGSDATWNLNTDAFKKVGASPAQSVKLTIGEGANGMEWKDGVTAFMTINAIDRSKNTLKSNYSVAYEFANTTITDNFDTKSNWLGGNVVRMSGTVANPDFDLRSQPYTLIKDNADYILMINSSFTGKVADIIEGTDVLDKYDNVASVEKVAIANVKTLIVAPDVEDPTTFAKFTALEKVVLENETELVAGMFNASGLKELEADKVTKVNEKFNANPTTGVAYQPAYVTLIMPAYEFNESKVINSNFFNASTKASLETLDISGVQDMAVPFEDITLAFIDYGKLAKVTVKDGVNVSQNAFKGCKALAEFTGSVNLTTFDATNSFNGTAITEIEIVGTKIPDQAFSGCKKLKTVTFDNSKLTSIGKEAFKECAALEYMDLANVATLGASAFEASALKAPNENVTVLTVGASKLPTNVFANTKVSLVRFTNATEMGSGILYGCVNLSQVRFDKAFGYTANEIVGKNTFGTAANVTLYIDKANQKNVSGSTLKTPATYNDKGAVTSWNSIEFKGIYDNAYWKE